ncbi:MAG: DNA-directed RNA polymerase subunit omega [Phycisphaerae bacterium]
MIEALKSDEVVNKVGGRFKLAVLVQKRLVDVTFGAPLLVERREGQTLMEAVIQEVLEGKITLERAEAKARAADEKEEDED